MKKIYLSDVTIRECSTSAEHTLSFREKLETAKMLDRLNCDSIEMPGIKNTATDTLLIKTVATLVKNSEILVPVGYETSSVEIAWNSVKEAKRPALKVSVPVSAVRMEYKCGKKPNMVMQMIKDLVSECKKYTDNIEFSAEDAVRAEKAFLYESVTAAVEAGASRVNFCDSEGALLPSETAEFFEDIFKNIPAISSVAVSAEISDKLCVATASALSAVSSGVTQIKTAVEPFSLPSIVNVMNIVGSRGDALGIESDIYTTEISRVTSQISRIVNTVKSETTPFENGVNDSDDSLTLDKNDDIGAVINAVKKIGYDLSAEDNANVYEAFKRVAQKKDFVGTKELEAIVASSALQVPPTYKIVSYVINSGNVITATANIALTKNDTPISGVSVGDGPIDAAFLAIEKIVGHHYELDDFQIRAVTEGTEAMGSSLVKLRSASGKLYSGTGISTDVIGASIRAYVSALNKIAYEEE